MAGQKTISSTFKEPIPPPPPPPEIVWVNPSFTSFSDPESAWSLEPEGSDWNTSTYAYTSVNGKALFLVCDPAGSGPVNRLSVLCADSVNLNGPVTVTIAGYLFGSSEYFEISTNLILTGSEETIIEIPLYEIEGIAFSFTSLTANIGRLYEVKLGLI